MNFLTSTAAIKDFVVFEIAGTKGVPNASLSSLRSVTAGVKQATMFFIQISVTVGWGGILEMMGKHSRWEHLICILSSSAVDTSHVHHVTDISSEKIPMHVVTTQLVLTGMPICVFVSLVHRRI